MRYFSPNPRLQLNGLHGDIFQKTLLVAEFRWTYFFHPGDGGDLILRNVGWNSRSYRASFPEDGTPFRFSLNLFLLQWRWRRYVPPKHRLKLNGVHGVRFPKTFLLVVLRWNYLIHPEVWGYMFSETLGWNSSGYSASYSRRRYCLSVCAELICSTLMMEAICSSQTSF
jgi:hypothetical protein